MQRMVRKLANIGALRAPRRFFGGDVFRDAEKAREDEFIRRNERQKAQKAREDRGERRGFRDDDEDMDFDDDRDDRNERDEGRGAQFSRDREQLMDIFDANDIAPNNRIINQLLKWKNGGNRRRN